MEMRRKDRQTTAEEAWAVVDKCLWGTLGMTDPEGEPYALPLSIAREENRIYFHCAGEGFKLACLKAHPRVCVTCVGDVHPMENRFTTEYESAVLRGEAHEVTDEAEKIRALELISRRYTPANMDAFRAAVEKSLAVTAVWRIDVTEITGKRRVCK